MIYELLSSWHHLEVRKLVWRSEYLKIQLRHDPDPVTGERLGVEAMAPPSSLLTPGSISPCSATSSLPLSLFTFLRHPYLRWIWRNRTMLKMGVGESATSYRYCGGPAHRRRCPGDLCLCARGRPTCIQLNTHYFCKKFLYIYSRLGICIKTK
jgi:hypothetical protein